MLHQHTPRWIKVTRFLLCLLLLCLSSYALAAQQEGPRIHAVSHIGHQFSFYADGRFHSQYLPGQPQAMNWGTLYNYDFSNANLLILLGCDEHLSYLPKDWTAIRTFLADGGGVVLFGSAGENPQNKLVNRFQCSFEGPAEMPLKAASPDITGAIEGRADWLKLEKPDAWEVLVADAKDRPVLVRKTIGKGTLLIASRGLAGSRPDAKDNINAGWWQPLLAKAAQGKPVDVKKPFISFGIDKLEYTDDLGTIKLHYSEYLKPYAKAMGEIYLRVKPVIEQRMGVPLSEGMAGEIGLLATGGGGFSSGRTLGLAVFWGGFPEQEDSMIEFITHESVHSWVLPFAEVWNEPIATYVGNLVMADMGYESEAMKRIQNTIERATRIDPTMTLYDLDGKSVKSDVEPLNGDKANAMHWGKTFWIFEQLRQENPDIVADYFKAKRRMAQPGKLKKYDMNATAAVLSVAMGRDMFGWFRDHGFDVDKTKSEIQ